VIKKWWPWVTVVGALSAGSAAYFASGDARAGGVGAAVLAATGYIVYRRMEWEKKK
jgi:hypothetical protein